MASPAPVPTRVRFDAFELDATSGELRKSGILLKLKPQPFRVLLLLIEHAGQVVTRAEIQRCLWSGSTFVDFEHGINFSINQIRGALADSAENPRYIETLPKRGYRFIGTIEQAPIPKEPETPIPERMGRITVLTPGRELGFKTVGPVAGADGSSVAAASRQDSAVNFVVTAKARKHLHLAVASVLVLSLIIGGVHWFTKRHPSIPQELILRQLTFNSVENPVKNGAISPDGKYLAYTDVKGMHIKLIETGDLLSVPEPETLKGLKVDWEISPWFPNSTRFLVNAHPLGLPWNSHGSSIWVVSVLGGPPRKLRDEALASAISPDGSTIAFSTNSGEFGDREIWLMGVNGEKARKLYESGEDGAVGGLSWFPHGQRVAYFTTDKSGDTLVTRELSEGPVTTIFSPSEMKKINDGIILPDGRLLYTLPQSDDAVDNICNYWVLRLDERTGARVDKPTRLTNWGESCMTGTTATADGKKLTFTKLVAHFQTYVADVEANGTRISAPRRLNLTESWDIPTDWTADSKALIFYSNRDGHYGIFKQSLNEDTAEPLVNGMGDAAFPHVSPDGAWMLYMIPTNEQGSSAGSQIIRVPMTGGAPQVVSIAPPGAALLCARSPASLCVIAERTEDHKQLVFKAFDVMKGEGSELLRVDYREGTPFAWDLSLDGNRIAFRERSGGPVRIFSLRDQVMQEIHIKGLSNTRQLDWAADGKGFFTSNSVQGGADLYYVDLQGDAHVLWKQRGGQFTYARPSPDGRHLAMMDWTMSGNIWMMENF